MAELNPVPNRQVLLESMLQKLRVNAQSDNGSQTEMSVESAETDSSAAYQFGFSSNNRTEQERHSLNWNNNERNQQSSSFGATSTPISNNPAKKIRKHVFSPKPKRAPLIWKGENQFPTEKNIIGNSWFRQEGENRDVLGSGLSPSFQTDPYQTPPDLLGQSLPMSTSLSDTPEIRGQSGIWTWGSGKDTGKPTKKSKKKWGDAKRWTKKMKERWRERHRATETEPRNDGERQALNEARNVSTLSVPIDVNNTTTKLVENLNTHSEPIDRGLDGAANSSPSYMSENLFSFSTSNLMEEIFSGTQWAQFLSVSSNTQNQPNESLSHINQSGEGKWTGTGHYTDMINSIQMSHHEGFTQDMAFNVPVYSRNHTSPIGDPSSHVANQLQTSVMYRNHLQNPDLSLSETHNFERMNEQSQFSHQFSNEHHPMSSQQSYSQSQVSDLNHNQPHLNHSYLKPMDSSSLNTRGSLQRKREHWTNRRDQFKYREDEDDSSSSSSSLSCPQYSEDSDSSVYMEIAVKKRKMDDSRHVRFAEEVMILPPPIWPEEDDEEEEEVVEEVKEEEKKEEVWPQDPPPRSSFPKWIVSLKGRRTKYKF
nr:uncharacterized protein zgc:113229 [Misgurnus anguillicaudatus]